MAIGGDDKGGEIALLGLDAGGGSRSVLERLYAQHWGELVRYVAAKFGSGPPDPEDVVQTAFTRFATAKNPGEIANERAFLYTTVRNVVLDHKRRETTQERYSGELQADAEWRERCELTPERVLIEKERLGALKDAMAKMPERRRLMFMLSRYEGVSGEKIGRHFGVSEAVVRKQIKIAMRECMDALEAAEDGEPDEAPGPRHE